MRKFLFFILIVPFYLSSQDNDKHESWQLDGASNRIEKYRKGDLILNFNIDKSIKNKTGKLKLKLKNHDFKFGVSFTQLRRFWGTKYADKYLQQVKRVFNYATVGMYWALTDERNNSGKMEKFYDDVLFWADKNNIRIKGHPLMWHEAMPDWIRSYKNLDELDMLIKNHMKRLIETYPQINDWDVYNEPIGPFKPHIPPSSIRDWINYKGGIYPAMVEIYNYVNSVSSSKNYSNNHYHAKDPEFFKINKFFIDQGLNYSSIGMQAHMQSEDNVMSEEQLWNQIEDYAILGKNIQFTEITVTSSKRFKNWKDHQVFLKKRDSIIKNGGEYDLPSLPSFEDFQSDYLKDFYTLAFSHPSVSSITIWNLTDQNAWRGHAGGVLFKDLTEKKSFLTLENLIKNRWSTKITKELNLNNEFSFRGFYGLYECELDIDGKVHKFEFNFNKEDKVVMIDI
jgi:GH35 family endo-1,4-beta-xylanase|tara:strand:- start:8857 stop:10212 length:1356 start_codon:yes stop_codon:yes gene_type:complete